MGVIHIENVDERILTSIRLRAEVNGHSFEEEVRLLLEDAAGIPSTPAERAAEADRIRAMTKGWSPETDSVAVIRELRDRHR